MRIVSARKPTDSAPALQNKNRKEICTMSNLLSMVRRYQELLEEKENLKEYTKANNAAIEEMKANLAQQMVDDDCPRISSGGYSYSLTPKTAYSKRSEEELQKAGLDFLDTLREEGLGSLIVETVNPRTLQSAMAAFVEENGELSEGLEQVIRTYDYNDITRRKETIKINGGKNNE